MASRRFALASPLPKRGPSPSVSAFRSSPLDSGSLVSYPITSSPFGSSPDLSSSCVGSSPSPDLFEPFVYTTAMDSDFRKIDAEGAQHYSQSLPSTPPHDLNTWVVFRGKVPGLYECLYVPSSSIKPSVRSFFFSEGAAMQTQGFSDAFQRVYPDRTSAEAAWNLYCADGTYPDYGKSPWVVYNGRRPGVFDKV